MAEFTGSIGDEQKRNHSQVILKLMEKAETEKPKMWGSSMIGFSKVRYKSPATGRELDCFKIGFPHVRETYHCILLTCSGMLKR